MGPTVDDDDDDDVKHFRVSHVSSSFDLSHGGNAPVCMLPILSSKS